MLFVGDHKVVADSIQLQVRTVYTRGAGRMAPKVVVVGRRFAGRDKIGSEVSVRRG